MKLSDSRAGKYSGKATEKKTVRHPIELVRAIENGWQVHVKGHEGAFSRGALWQMPFTILTPLINHGDVCVTVVIE